MVPLGESDKDEVLSEETRPSESSDTESHIPKEIELPENGVTTLEPDNPPPIKSEKREPGTDSATDAPRSIQWEKSSPRKPKKALQIPESSALALVSSQEVSTPSSIREKVSEDGYNWRKYGQKLVKGNEYVRSYYRCTHPNCPVKKQLERLHEGQIVDIVYFGQHVHSKPQINIPVAVGFAVSVVEERRKEPSVPTAEVYVQSPKTPLPKPVDTPPISKALAIVGSKGTISQSNKLKDEVFCDDDPDPKRQKKERDSLKSTALDKSTSDSRLVIQTRSEVDVVNDGYRWRKYGQKLVKGNLNPRSYYRCSNSGCPVKKHVERASYDPEVVITTYEGQHSHGAPPTRVVTYNVSGSSDSPPTPNSESGPKSNGNAPCLDLVVDAFSEHENKTEKEPNAKPDKPHKRKTAVKEENMAAESRAIKSNLEGNSNSNSCAVNMVVRDGIKTEVKNPDLEPVQGRITWR